MFGFIIDALFPHACVGCQKMGTLLCKQCVQTIILYNKPIALDLEDCALESVIAMAKYGGVIKPAVAQLKYHSLKDVGTLLGKMIHERCKLPSTSIITSVPLHPTRKKERGFNQAEIIAKEIARRRRIPYYQLLKRNRNTTSQVSTGTRAARLAHLSDAFSLSEFAKKHLRGFQNASVLLVDDVITTGTTLNECAHVLKANGFFPITGLGVAHGTNS